MNTAGSCSHHSVTILSRQKNASHSLCHGKDQGKGQRRPPKTQYHKFTGQEQLQDICMMWSFKNAFEDKSFHSGIGRFHQTEQMKRKFSKRKHKVYLECDKDEEVLHQSCVDSGRAKPYKIQKLMFLCPFTHRHNFPSALIVSKETCTCQREKYNGKGAEHDVISEGANSRV